jgi:hypothetical protein
MAKFVKFSDASLSVDGPVDQAVFVNKMILPLLKRPCRSQD